MSAPTPEKDYGRFRLALVARILTEKLTPAQVADVLSEAGGTQKPVLYDEVHRLRAMGDKWR